MKVNCNKEGIKFQDSGKQKVIGSFAGGLITSDAGGLLLREIDKTTEIIKKFSNCFTDYRAPNRIEHRVEDLLSQRIYGLALGYEDLNDHENLRYDPLMSVLVGKTGILAGKSTLNRLELTPASASKKDRYQKIVHNPEKIEELFVDIFIWSHEKEPEEITLDLDATEDEIHGNQEGKFYQGYYQCYCYLPLYIYCGDFLLCAKLRKSDIDASSGSIEEVERITNQIRQKWLNVKIKIRGDGGFCRDEIMSWCESKGYDYIVGLAKNNRLLKEIKTDLELARITYEESGKSARYFSTFEYKTLESWSCTRQVVGKSEYLDKGANPRFIVTSLKPSETGRELYEDDYCARGEMENRIKEMKSQMYAGRTSTKKFRSNQLRLWFSAIAYVLFNELRRVGLKATELANAECSTIRNKVLKLGALIIKSTKQVKIKFAIGYPYSELFKTIFRNLKEYYT